MGTSSWSLLYLLYHPTAAKKDKSFHYIFTEWQNNSTTAFIKFQSWAGRAFMDHHFINKERGLPSIWKWVFSTEHHDKMHSSNIMLWTSTVRPSSAAKPLAHTRTDGRLTAVLLSTCVNRKTNCQRLHLNSLYWNLGLSQKSLNKLICPDMKRQSD